VDISPAAQNLFTTTENDEYDDGDNESVDEGENEVEVERVVMSSDSAPDKELSPEMAGLLNFFSDSVCNGHAAFGTRSGGGADVAAHLLVCDHILANTKRTHVYREVDQIGPSDRANEELLFK
jgi:hypothetical protein